MSKAPERTPWEMWVESPEQALHQAGDYKLLQRHQLFVGALLGENPNIQWAQFSRFIELIVTRGDLNVEDVHELFSILLSIHLCLLENINPLVRNATYLPHIVNLLKKIPLDQETLNLIKDNPGVCQVLNHEIKNSVYCKDILLSEETFDELVERIVFPDIKNILSAKGISKELLRKSSLKISDPIPKHIDDIYTYIYSQPLKIDHLHPQEGSKRSTHDIVHVSKVVLFAYALLVLYAGGDIDLLPKTTGSLVTAARKILLNFEQSNMLLISALLHDSGRQGEKKDHWDFDSGLIIYYYLTNRLGVSPLLAKVFAEATANKDAKSNGFYFQLKEYKPGHMRWEQGALPPEALTFFTTISAIIGDADRLDVQRVRKIFYGKEMNYYHYFAAHHPKYADILGRLINEVAAVLDQQGDSYFRSRLEIKKKFQDSKAFDLLMKDILRVKPHSHPASHLQILPQLLKSGKPLTPVVKDSEKSDEKIMISKIKECKVFFRGISMTTSVITNMISKRTGAVKPPRTNIELELDKIDRTPDKETRAGHLGKHGFQNRSVLMPGFTIATFTNAGLILSDDKIANDIVSVSSNNMNSGFGKKKSLPSHFTLLKPAEVPAALRELSILATINGREKKHLHNEVIMTVKRSQVKGIFFCEGPNAYNRQKTKQYHAFHQHTPALEAIAIQHTYARKFNEKLPIWQYSRTPWFMIQKSYTDKEIVDMWVQMCHDYLDHTEVKTFKNLDTLKIFMMYGDEVKGTFYPADIDYPQELQKKLDLALNTLLLSRKVNFGLETESKHLSAPLLNSRHFRFNFSADNEQKILDLTKYLNSVRRTSFQLGINHPRIFLNIFTQNATSKCIKGLKNPGKKITFTPDELQVLNTDPQLEAILRGI